MLFLHDFTGICHLLALWLCCKDPFHHLNTGGRKSFLQSNLWMTHMGIGEGDRGSQKSVCKCPKANGRIQIENRGARANSDNCGEEVGYFLCWFERTWKELVKINGNLYIEKKQWERVQAAGSRSSIEPHSLDITVQPTVVSILPVKRIIHPFCFVLSGFLTLIEHVYATC